MKTILAVLCCRTWVGVLISGLASYFSSKEEAEAIGDENERSREETEKANKIRLAQYEREQRFEENKFAYQKNQDRIKRFEGFVGENAALGDRLSKVWG